MNRKATRSKRPLREAVFSVGLLVFTTSCGLGGQTPAGWRQADKAPLGVASSAQRPSTASPSFALASGDNFVVQAKPDADFGSITAASNDLPTRIAISPSALQKEFVLRANLISGGLAPSFQGLKTRVVSFREQAGKLVLAEAGQGYSFYNDVPQDLILASFPILARTPELIYFDFNAGMTKLYTTQDMYASNDSEPTEPNFSEHYEAVAVDVAFIKHAELRAGDELLIEQAAQLAVDSSYLPVEVRYYFSPYQANPTFTASVSPPKKQAGFFEVSPSFNQQTHQNVVYAAKFDRSQAIVFAISANTPAAFKDSIRQGVLYWNKAFGENRLEVVDAAEGVSAPSYDANIIQWVDWQMDGGYMAFADAQMDPRSGQVLNAQVFMTSSFVAYGRDQAQRIVKRLTENALLAESQNSAAHSLTSAALQNSFSKLLAGQAAAPTAPTHALPLGLRGFAHTPLCQASAPASYVQALSQLIAQQAPDAAFLRIAQDLVRTTIAHEIGHVLGLRHNFAGSHAANYEAAARSQLIADYLRHESVPDGLVVTSSVMDYFPFEEMAIIGHQLKQESANAFTHDRLAIAALYDQLDLSDHPDSPAFCTDHQVGSYVDCDRHMFGASPLAFAQASTAEAIKRLPEFLANYFIHHVKSPRPGVRPRSARSVQLSPLNVAFQALAPRAKALRTLLADRRSLASDAFQSSDPQRRRAAYAQQLASELSRLGGWSAVLDHTPADFASQAQARFVELIHSPPFKSGVGPGGAYEFSDEELLAMMQAAHEFFIELEKALATIDLIQLASIPQVGELSFLTAAGDTDSSLADSFASYLAAKAAETILASHPQPIVTSLNVPATASVQGLRRVITLQLVLREQLDPLEIGVELNSANPLPQQAIDAVVSEQLTLWIDALMERSDIQAMLASLDFDLIAAQLLPQAAPATGRHGSSSEASFDEAADAAKPENPESSQFELAAIPLSDGIPNWLAAGFIDSDKALSPSPASNAVMRSAVPQFSDAQKDAIKASVGVYATLAVSLQHFKRPFAERSLATMLLDKQRGPQLDFAVNARAKLRRLFQRQLLRDLRQKDFTTITYEDQAKPTNNWLQENISLLKALAPTA